jgi:hypothetical protein
MNDKIITVSGTNITDAIMNEVKIFNGVADVKLLKHWVETAFLAKKIKIDFINENLQHILKQQEFNSLAEQLKFINNFYNKDFNKLYHAEIDYSFELLISPYFNLL